MQLAQPSLKLAAISMTTGPDRQRNIQEAYDLVRQAADLGADWIQLPEMWPFMGPYSELDQHAEPEGGPLYQELARWAQSLEVVLIAGTMAERPDAQTLPSQAIVSTAGHRRVFNTTYVFGRDGCCLAKYRKIHLFNLVGDDGRPTHQESDGFLAGETPTTVMVDGWRLGLSICYDLRFSALYDLLAREGDPDIVAVPSAFTKMTGAAHWELLLRARAVERQCYVFAANQTGVHGPGKESFGHSLIVDPWGEVLAQTWTEPGLALAEVRRSKIDAVRSRLPALNNRRADFFKI